MDFLNGLSDDQTAFIGCAFALLASGTIMSLSYYVGRFFQKSQQSPEPHEPQTLRMPAPASVSSQKRHHIHATAELAEPHIRRAA